MNASHDDTRSAILHAAVEEFASLGPDGARMEAIARAAGVNKALLHYYFGSKEGLYEAALEGTLSGIRERQQKLLAGPGEPGRRLLRYLLYSLRGMAARPAYSRMIGHEMVRARAGNTASLTRMADTFFRPLVEAILAALREGIQSGEFRPVDPAHTMITLLGNNIFYLHSTPIYRAIAGSDPRDPDLLESRRLHVADLAVCLLFADREAGARLAAEVLEETAAPHS